MVKFETWWDRGGGAKRPIAGGGAGGVGAFRGPWGGTLRAVGTGSSGGQTIQEGQIGGAGEFWRSNTPGVKEVGAPIGGSCSRSN